MFFPLKAFHPLTDDHQMTFVYTDRCNVGGKIKFFKYSLCVICNSLGKRMFPFISNNTTSDSLKTHYVLIHDSYP